MSTSVLFSAAARLDDPTAMDALIASVPRGEQLHDLMTRPSGWTHQYDQETRTDRYITTNGKLFMCVTVTDLTPEQAAAIEVEVQHMGRWSPPAFLAAVERVLGESVTVERALDESVAFNRVQ